MALYAGMTRGDKPRGGGAYVEKEGVAYEVFNFEVNRAGIYYGFVRPPGHGEARIRLEKLGATRNDDRLEGVQVFWAATHPLEGRTRIVGWYEDATVFREWQPSPGNRRLPNDEDAIFNIQTTRARLIPTDDRVFMIPRASAGVTGMGQSNIWYPPSEWAKKLLNYQRDVLSDSSLRSVHQGRAIARTSDLTARLRVERMAMEAAIGWCHERSLHPRDVSLNRYGWDLEAGYGREMLRIEVKGSSLPIGAALLELTPNEFARMKEHRASFRLAVVSVVQNAPTLAMFAWSSERGAWTTADGMYTLALREIVAARVEVVDER